MKWMILAFNKSLAILHILIEIEIIEHFQNIEGIIS